MKKLIAILLSVVCLFNLCVVPVMAEETTNNIIDSSNHGTLSMTLDGKVCWCVDRNAVMPDAGFSYAPTEFNNPERLSRVAVAIHTLDNGTTAFHIASQYAVWQCYESLDMVLYSGAIEGAEVSNYVQSILDAADEVDLNEWNVDIKFYGFVATNNGDEPNEYGYQSVATFNVSAKNSEPEPPIIPDEPETTSVSVIKAWSGEDANRPNSVSVQLYNNGIAHGDVVVLNADNNWSYTWNELAIDGVWTVDEVNVPENYEKAIAQNGNAFTITNTYVAPIIPEPTGKTEIPEIIIDGEKYFCVEKDKLAPDESDVYEIDNEYVITDDLRRLAVVLNGKEYSNNAIVYAVWDVVSEEDISSEINEMLNAEEIAEYNEIMGLLDDVDLTKYDVEVSVYKPLDDCKQRLAQFSATLKTTSVSVSKAWSGEDANRPTSVNVQLYNNGVAHGDVIVLNADNDWSYTWSGLAIDGVWTVDEVNVPENYNKTVTQNGNAFTITNTYEAPIIPEPTLIDIAVVKVWDDEENENRPTSIEVQLYKDGVAHGEEVVLSAENSWTYIFEDLDDAFEWTVDEVSVPENYEKTVTANGNNVTITNTYVAPVIPEPEMTSVSVIKTWEGDNDSIRPSEVKVQLYKNGVADGDAITLNAENNWSYTWNDLSADYRWTVDEVNVPENYEKNISQTEQGFRIVNTYVQPEDPTEPSEPSDPTEPTTPPADPDNPQTGDNTNLGLWFALMFSSLAGIVVLALTKKRIA